jgi:hypothetical protein
MSCLNWSSFGPVSTSETVKQITEAEDIPIKNLAILKYAEEVGDSLAPTYTSAVCTEYLVKILEHFTKLSVKEKRTINIVGIDTLIQAINADAPGIRGVQTALVKSKKGTSIDDPNEVKPGDLVQFWNLYWDVPKGHCGIVLDVQPNRYLTLISSSKSTEGHGVQTYYWPEKAYFVRLN